MRRWSAAMMLAIVVAIALAIVPGLARSAEPTVRVKVVGPQPVVAGQSVQIEVTILAPNFFLSAPLFPALQVPGAVVTMPDERGVNSTETIDGTSYAGIRKTYLFTPQTGGDFALPTPPIHFAYAGDGGKPQEATVTLPPTTIRAGGQQGGGVPAASSSSSAPAAPLLPAAPIRIRQTFDPPLAGKTAHLRAGDALVRTISIFAPGTPAMMIEPPALPAVRGARQFRADPVLQDGVTPADEPAGAAGGRRVEAITYVFESSGRYTLPAVSVAWYDPATGKRAQTVAPPVTVEVGRAAAGIGLAPSGGLPLRWPDWLDWRGVAAFVVAVLGLGYGGLRWRRGWRPALQPARRGATAYRGHRRPRGTLPPLNP